MAHPVPLQTALILLHAGHGHVPLPVYLSRVFLVLLAFTILAVGTYWCLGAVDTFDRAPVAERDAEDADR